MQQQWTQIFLETRRENEKNNTMTVVKYFQYQNELQGQKREKKIILGHQKYFTAYKIR